jgi:glycosyltransferase involved in cell wall biosynthesis
MPDSMRPSAPTAATGPREALRVCVVAPSLRILGGQAIQAQRLMSHLRAVPGARVGFVPHNPALPGPLAWLQRVRFVRTVVNTAAYVALLLVRLPRYDIVHVFSAAYWSYFLGPMFAILVGRLYGKQVILNYRSGELEDHLERWGAVAVRTMGMATRIVTPTPYLTGVYAKFGLRAEVIPNYLDVERLTYRVRDPLRPVFLVNRLFEPLYNYPCSLDAFRRIQAAVPDARLVIAGYGPLREQILAWIEEMGLRNVDFRGKVTHAEMMALYQQADIYLNSPNLDCFPSSILDAFAAGVPVVTTNAGGIRHIVEHDRTGWMVECGDSAGLAEGALRLLAEPDYARRLAAAGRRELESRYVWDAVGPQWEAMYRELSHA